MVVLLPVLLGPAAAYHAAGLVLPPSVHSSYLTSLRKIPVESHDVLTPGKQIQHPAALCTHLCSACSPCNIVCYSSMQVTCGDKIFDFRLPEMIECTADNTSRHLTIVWGNLKQLIALAGGARSSLRGEGFQPKLHI